MKSPDSLPVDVQSLGLTRLLPSYPKRESCFAFRFCRSLAKRVVANELGSAMCWMLTAIVMQEDARRYSGAVTFYNEQLLPICGFASVGVLDRCRKKAIAAGWLHYEPGGKGRPGKYWVLAPEVAECDDSPIDEGNPTEFSIPNGQANGVINGRKAVGKRKPSGDLLPLPHPPNPSPNTLPLPHGGDLASPGECVFDARSCNNVNGKPGSATNLPDGFEEWWTIYPRKEKKPRAEAAFRKVIKSLSIKYGSSNAALEWLRERTRLFATSEIGQHGRFCPHPANWLNDERFNDEPAEWNRQQNENQRTRSHQFGAGQVYQPDAGDGGKDAGGWVSSGNGD